MGDRVAAAVWRIDPDLVLALDAHLGGPVDSYLNGTQTWLTEDGPGGVTLEWRLHPVGAYRPPAELSHYDLWEQVVDQLGAGRDPGALRLGGEQGRPLTSLWDGLEVFAAYGEDLEPATLAQAARLAIDRAPDATGLVDHEHIGEAWERADRNVSMVGLLLDELRA